MKKILSFSVFLLLVYVSATAQDLKLILLPAPDTTGGKPLMQALKLRQSTREYSKDTLSLSVLGNLLWAACGINRADDKKRTAPSAMNWQEIEVYVATTNGLFLYDPLKHALIQILPDDIREKTGMQPFVKEVPVNLIYVADNAKVTRGGSDKDFYNAADAAFISENVYLYCASAGLATVVRGSVNRDEMSKVMKLRPDQKVILAQSVGYPKK